MARKVTLEADAQIADLVAKETKANEDSTVRLELPESLAFREKKASQD